MSITSHDGTNLGKLPRPQEDPQDQRAGWIQKFNDYEIFYNI